MKKAMLALGAIAALAGSAQAALLFSITQTGPDVVITGSGSLNLASLEYISLLLTGGALEPSKPSVGVGPLAIETKYFLNNFSATGGLGNRGSISVNRSSGDTFGFYAEGPYHSPLLFVPYQYPSGRALSGTATITGKTLADLGLTPGSTLTWSWSRGGNADSLRVTVVPEPHQYAMAAGLGLVGIGLWRRHARK